MARKKPTAIKDSLPTDTVVKCHECGRTEEISFLDAMKNGWPNCHREGMHLDDTSANIQDDIKKLTGFSHRNFSHSKRMEHMKKEMELRNGKTNAKEKKRNRPRSLSNPGISLSSGRLNASIYNTAILMGAIKQTSPLVEKIADKKLLSRNDFVEKWQNIAINSNSKKPIYTCGDCGRTSSKQSRVFSHIFSIHPETADAIYIWTAFTED